ncbi:hypothetical protein Syun_027088 [Stephania yunnanensis]|uniref:Terpene synthase N-terminal domain-containing protein n=1 Tax=Stephania yunnanensis TaxID=152371 RepID=A0AAP0EK18_9MAGN
MKAKFLSSNDHNHKNHFHIKKRRSIEIQEIALVFRESNRQKTQRGRNGDEIGGGAAPPKADLFVSGNPIDIEISSTTKGEKGRIVNGGEFYEKQRNKLVESVRHILLNDQNMGSLAKFELIEALQRLGIRYFFEEEIEKVLMNGHEIITSKEGLHVVALRFKLLRQQGYRVSLEDVFGIFKDTNSYCFKESLCEDAKGMLSLYEAAHFALEGEDILEEAKAFTTKHLKEHYIKSTPTID